MKHHEPLIAMRRRHCRPEAVFLIVDCADDEDARWADRDPGHAHIAIEPRDVPSRLDLRFLVGCTVHVMGLDDARIHEVFDAAVAAGASRVAAVFDGDAQFHHRVPASYLPAKG